MAKVRGLCQAFLGTLITPICLALCFCTLISATARLSSLGVLAIYVSF